MADDMAEPYLASDEELYSYINDAISELVVAGRLIRDVKQYSVAEGDQWVAMGASPVVLEVRKAELIDANDNRFELRLKGTMDNAASFTSDYGLLIPSNTARSGRPTQLIFGRRTNYFELQPIPNAAFTIEASVALYPSMPLEGADDEPEIDERYHLSIPVGAALRAVEAADYEQPSPTKLQSLGIAWQRALARAAEDSGRISRDASTVYFSNDLW
jgi:hypothetical protein